MYKRTTLVIVVVKNFRIFFFERCEELETQLGSTENGANTLTEIKTRDKNQKPYYIVRNNRKPRGNNITRQYE